MGPMPTSEIPKTLEISTNYVIHTNLSLSVGTITFTQYITVFRQQKTNMNSNIRRLKMFFVYLSNQCVLHWSACSL